MRRLTAILAALVFAGAAHAITPPQRVLMTGGVPQLPAPSVPAPQPSTFLGFAQFLQGGSVNAGITIPTGALAPPAGPNAWVYIQKFQADDQIYNTPAGQNSITLAGTCSTSSCNSAGFRYLQIQNPRASPTLTKQAELLFQMGRNQGGTNYPGWTTPCSATCASTGIQLTPGTNYCVVVAQYANSAGGQMSISAIDNHGNIVPGISGSTGAVQTTANNGTGSEGFYYHVGTGYVSSATLGNLFNTIGTTITNTTAYNNGTNGPIGDVAMIQGTLSNTSGTPTTAALQNLCNGTMSLATWITTYVSSPTLTGHYTLGNPSSTPVTGATTWAADPSGAVTTAATTFGTSGVLANIVPASPLTPAPCLTLNERGPYDVAPLDAGQSGTGTGSIRVSGSVNAASCGFTPTSVDGQIVNISTGLAETPWVKIPVVGTTFNAMVGGVPGSTPSVGFHRISVRLHQSKSYALQGQYPIAVCFSYLRIGQSQVTYMTSPGYNGAGTGSLLAGNGTLTQSVVQLSDSGNTPTNHGVMHASQILLDSNTNPGSQSVNQIAGDGIVEEANDISTGLGCSPVKIISVAKAGQSSNSWGLDYLPVTYPLTNTAGTFSMPAWASQTAGGWATALNTVGTGVEFVSTAATIPTSANTGAGPQLTMLVGSLQIKDSLGTLLATDANCTPGTDPCTLSYAGVTAGTVNHLTGVIAGLTFSVTPTNLPVSATWTNISDTLAGQYTQQSTYVGFPTWGNGTSITSGYGTAVLLNQVQPVSANVFEQCTADSGTMTGTTPPATNNANYQLSWATMWNNTFYTKIASLPFWRAGTPTLVLGYGRDAGAAPGSVSKCRQALRVLGSGPPSGVTGGPYAFLGDYYDDVTQLSGSVYLGIGPHEGPWLHGGRRMARRAAAMMVAYQTQNFTKASEPQIICAQAAAGCYTTGTAPVRAPAGGGPLTTCGTNCIEFTVYMPNSGALTNCGTNLSGSGAGNITGGTGGVSSTSLVVSASTGPNLVPGMIITGTGTNSGGAVVGSADTNLGTTGTFTLSVAQTIANGTALSAIPGGACTPPGTPVGTAVYGFRFGTAASTVYNYNGWTGSGNLVDANQTSCVISSATTVDCTGTLISSGNIYWTYADDAPLSDAGTEKPLTVTGGTGYGVNAGPTTVTDTTLTGAINASASPGTCTHPTVSMTTNAAGVVSATRLAPGSVCVGTPTFAIPTSGGAWSGVGVGGSVVGSVFGVADDINHLGQVLYDNTGYCNGVISATTYEPGCPVAPITIPQGPVT